MEFGYNEKEFFKQGYYIKNQCVYNKKNQKLYLHERKDGYFHFNFIVGSRTDNSRKHISVLLHRAIAYQKYGNAIYIKGIEARHKDNDRTNNDPSNILIGTHSRNMMDVPKIVRLKKSIHAASFNRKFSDIEVENIIKYHTITKSYKKQCKNSVSHQKGLLDIY